MADQIGEAVKLFPGEMLRETTTHSSPPRPIRRPVRHDLHLPGAAFPADKAPRLRKIDENEARGQLDRFEGHDSVVLAGAIQAPHPRPSDALGAKIGDRRRGGVHDGRRSSGQR